MPVETENTAEGAGQSPNPTRAADRPPGEARPIGAAREADLREIENRTTERVFELGLTMAGAVSAGAYTGGVLDFLVQALTEWEEERGKPGVPDHRVVLKVLTGTSAGAITAGLGILACAGDPDPQGWDGLPVGSGADAPKQPYSKLLPLIYKAWVEQPRMVAPEGTALPCLLGLDDLKTPGPVKSVLDSSPLDAIADQALQAAGAGAPKAWFTKTVHVYMMVSNLRGVPYAAQFVGGKDSMQCHGNRMHFSITGMGVADRPSRFADSDPSIPLAADALKPGQAKAAPWPTLTLSALASGAFPVGLAPRVLSEQSTAFHGRKWPVDADQTRVLSPDWPTPWDTRADWTYTFTNVDGGMINNEPFEYARWTLRRSALSADAANSEAADPGFSQAALLDNEQSAELADRGVIMIDPFPAPPAFPPEGHPPADLMGAVKALFPTMINQARFKPDELIQALNDDIKSRFLIDPRRVDPKTGEEAQYTIACGLLGGFGGFLDETFRAHDYQLGRRNCQKFLMSAFTLAETNPLFGGDGSDCDEERPIIPLLGTAALEVPLLPWPRMPQSDLDRINDAAKARVDALIPRFIEDSLTGKRWLRWLARLGVSFVKGALMDQIRFAMLSDLVLRDQLASWILPSQSGGPAAWKRPLPAGIPLHQVRMVLSALLDPGWELRTVKGIAGQTALSEDTVRAVLDTCKAEDGSPWQTWQAGWTRKGTGEALYTSILRKPSWWNRIPVVRGVSAWFAEPAID